MQELSSRGRSSKADKVDDINDIDDVDVIDKTEHEDSIFYNTSNTTHVSSDDEMYTRVSCKYSCVTCILFYSTMYSILTRHKIV